MLKRFKRYLESALSDQAGSQRSVRREHALRLATAALMLEISAADFENQDVEEIVILKLLRERFSLDDTEVRELMRAAAEQSERTVSLHEFTRLLHEHLSVAEKHKIIEMLWRVSFADSRLHKYEDHLVRKVAGLLYVSHRDLVRIRNKVRSSLEPDREP